ncbi:hypothetical protein BKA61DRAFT_668499 [Leptodontidium sp. MPI-SDFR-AT-0119]|nr:hypothetical protein BKA61DRAFT_668499 [Leptodontidium sp. MPI-SDFR-AT-0119]
MTLDKANLSLMSRQTVVNSDDEKTFSDPASSNCVSIKYFEGQNQETFGQMEQLADLMRPKTMISKGPIHLVIRLGNGSEMRDKSPQSTKLEALKVLPEVGTSNLPIKGKGPAYLDHPTPREEDDDPFGFFAKGLEDILLGEETASYAVFPGSEEEEIHICSQAMGLDLLGAAGQLVDRRSAIIQSGLGIGSLLFVIASLIRNHASGGNGKKGSKQQVFQVHRAARDKDNVKKHQLAEQRRKRKHDKDKARKAKRDFAEGNDRWLCHICDANQNNPTPQDNIVPLCPKCDHSHAKCKPCHDPANLAEYFRVKRENRERDVTAAKATRVAKAGN